MHKLTIVLAILALGSVTACTINKPPIGSIDLSEGTAAQQSDTETAALNAALETVRHKCEAQMRDPALDPIRGKIELMRDIPDGGDNSPPPLSIMMNNATPTQDEKVAIEKWANIYDDCIREGYEVTEAWATPELTSLGHQIDQRITTLIAALIKGEITYTAFATKRVDLANQQLTAIELLEKGSLTSRPALNRASQLVPVSIPEVTAKTSLGSSLTLEGVEEPHTQEIKKNTETHTRFRFRSMVRSRSSSFSIAVPPMCKFLPTCFTLSFVLAPCRSEI
jgi:hypothetical protein